MPANLLVAKRSYARLKAALKRPIRRTQLIDRRRIVRSVGANERKVVKLPVVIPACSIAKTTTSSAKPAVAIAKTSIEPTSISATSVITDRIVSVIKPAGERGAASLGIRVKPKQTSRGIQVGRPSPELNQERAANATTFIEPPLKGYWTHKINLPYPPSTIPQLPAQQIYQPPPVGYWVEGQPQWYPPQFAQPPPSNFIAQQPVYQPQVYQQQGPLTPSHPPAFNRKQRRNNVKRQKFTDRHHR